MRRKLLDTARKMAPSRNTPFRTRCVVISSLVIVHFHSRDSCSKGRIGSNGVFRGLVTSGRIDVASLCGTTTLAHVRFGVLQSG